MSKLSPEAQKRVDIARDALAQIALGTVRPKKGTFGHPRDAHGRAVAEKIGHHQAMALPEVACEACAIGSMFIALIKKDQREFRPDLGIYGAAYYNLKRYFEMEQLAEMESAFEGWDFSDRGLSRRVCDDRHGEYIDRYPDATRRLVAILENVVRNGGRFDIDDRREGIPAADSRIVGLIEEVRATRNPTPAPIAPGLELGEAKVVQDEAPAAAVAEAEARRS